MITVRLTGEEKPPTWAEHFTLKHFRGNGASDIISCAVRLLILLLLPILLNFADLCENYWRIFWNSGLLDVVDASYWGLVISRVGYGSFGKSFKTFISMHG